MVNKLLKIPSIKVNVVLNILRTLMTLLFPLITFPYASRILLPEGIGKVSFARSFIDYFVIIATLGIVTYGTRETAKVRDDRCLLSKISKEIFTINLVSTAIAYVLLYLAIFLIDRLLDYRTLLIVIGSKILFIALGMEWLYSGLEDYKYITARAFVFQIISVILLFVFVRKPEDYLKYASIAVVSNVGSNICNWIHCKKYISFSIVKKLEIKKHLKPIFILFAMAAISILYVAIDVTMLGFMCGDWEVGIYTSATKINRIFIPLIAAVGSVVLPRLSYYVGKNENEKFFNLVYKNYEMLFLLSIPCSIGLMLVGEAVILAFSGKNFIAAIPAMQILTPIIVVIGIGTVTCTQTFVPMGKEKLVLYGLIIGAVSNILLNFILIPQYKVFGAAIATLCSESVLSGIELFWGRKILDLKKIGSYFLLYLFNSLVMAVFVFLCLRFIPRLWISTFVAICVGVLVYGILLVLEKNRFVMDMFKIIAKKII